MHQHKPRTLPPEAVICTCGYVLYDGEVIRTRVIKLHEQTALCRCKRWVGVPVEYSSQA